jgi:D-alanyl-D-alanine carboxypeptidase
MMLAAVAGWSLSAWGELQVVDTVAGQQATAAPANALTTPTVPDQPTAPPDVPPCTVGDQPTEGDPAADWATILVDATYKVPGDFVPPDLVGASTAGFDTDDQIRQIIVADLDALREAAEAAGTPVGMVSAYRSHTYQEGLFASEVEQRGAEQAQLTTARPGHSEHQLGTAVDLIDAAGSPLDESFAQTPTAQWLAAHAHEFGFVTSYPDVAPERTCYQFEPWHLRYVGQETAAAVHDSGVTLREWQLTH